MSANLPFFWQLWVVGLILVSLSFLTYAVIRICFPKQEHTQEDVVWDETLVEGPFAPPKWWFWLTISALFYSVIYMALYPGFGNYNGFFDLTTAKQYQQGKERIDHKYFSKLDQLNKSTDAQLAKNKDAMRLAENIYNNSCLQCHGANAQGQLNTFPNLKDDAWSWGGTTEQIAHTIKQGRTAIMPAWQALLNDQGVNDVAHYVQSLSVKNEIENANGKEKFEQFCASCHGLNGAGNILFGAPNLTDNSWLYGGDLDAIKTSIALGRTGVMPKQEGRLNDLQIRLLSVWLTK